MIEKQDETGGIDQNETVRYKLSDRLKEWIDRWHYHSEVKDHDRFVKINDATRDVARLIMTLTPEGPEQTLALRHLEDARMRANQSIVLERYE